MNSTRICILQNSKPSLKYIMKSIFIFAIWFAEQVNDFIIMKPIKKYAVKLLSFFCEQSFLHRLKLTKTYLYFSQRAMDNALRLVYYALRSYDSKLWGTRVVSLIFLFVYVCYLLYCNRSNTVQSNVEYLKATSI